MAVIKLGDLTTFEGDASGSWLVMNDPTNTATYKVQREQLMSGSTVLSASYALTASYLDNYVPPFPYTGSAEITGSLTVIGSTNLQSVTASSLLTTGTITAQTLVVQTITSSVDFVTGSTRFGTQLTNTHQFTGSVSVTGSLSVNNSVYVSDNRIGIGTSTPGNTLHISASNTTNSQVRIGTLEIQNFSLNNSWFGDNVYFNGTNFIARQTGFTGMFYFFNNEGQFRLTNSVSAGTGVGTGNTVQLKINSDGTFAVGSAMTSAASSYTNAKLLFFGSTGNLALNSTVDTGYRLLVSGSGASGSLNVNNTLYASGSRVGIGTTNPENTLQIVGNGIRGQSVLTDATPKGFDIVSGHYTNSQPPLAMMATAVNLTQAILWIGGGNALYNSATDIRFFTGDTNTTLTGAERARFFSNGNFVIGTTTDSGDRFQVSGSTLLRGTGNTSATFALTVQNSGGTNIFRVRNDSNVLSDNITAINGAMSISSTGGAIAGNYLVLNNGGLSFTNTSGNINHIRFLATFAPTSGTGTYVQTAIDPTINQTGGANGITRGLYINPTLTSAADWRSIEWSNNTGWGLYGAGTANNYVAGNLLIGSTNNFSRLYVGGNTGAANITYAFAQPVLNGSFTDLNCFRSSIVPSGTVTLTNANHFSAVQSAIGTATITNQFGFQAASSLTGATNNYGFYGDIASGTGRWNLYMNGTALNYLNGSLLVGTTTDAGFKLDVNGTARIQNDLTIKGSGTTSATTALTIQNSSNSTYLQIRNDGSLIGNTAGTAVGAVWGLQSYIAFQGRTLSLSGTTGGGTDYLINSKTFSAASTIAGTINFNRFNNSFTHTANANIVGNILLIDPTINQTGGANGITRGLFVNPTLTAAADWRSIEWNNNASAVGSGSWGLYGAGTAPNYLRGNLGINTLSPSQSLDVSGSARITANLTASRAFLSSSNGTASGSTLIVFGSGSAQPVFTVQGSQGELFSVTDSLSGSLFSVNDVSGLPVIEAFSDNTVLIGSYQAPMLTTTVRTTLAVGNNVIYRNVPTASYDAVFFEYSLRSGSNARAGSIMGIWSGSDANYNEVVTADFGDTTGVKFMVMVTGSNIALTGSAATANWTMKTIVRGI